MGHGNLHVLWQPAELIIIGGAAVGSMLISNPTKVLMDVVKKLPLIFTGKAPSKEEYLEALGLMNALFSKMRKEGLIAIESDIENPAESAIFAKYPKISANHHAVGYIADNLKVVISTNVTPFELDSVMEMEAEVHHTESLSASQSITRVGDALPALGIVAAVLGVILTMGKIAEPPEVLGHHIGAALVGTFLGILMAYGFVSPFGTNLEHNANEGSIIFLVIKVALVSFVGGAAPQIAVEFARRAIPSTEKPTFNELEESLRS